MQVNWFTVIAQVLNFLILVWLLKRFLYKPILKAIDERENKIARQIKDAEDQDSKAKKEHAEFVKKNEAFDLEKKELMAAAVSETNDARQKLLDEARNEANELRSKLEKSMKEMQKNMSRNLVKSTQHEVFAIARKTLADLASLSLEEQSANIFIKRLKELSSKENKQFVEAFKKGLDPILVQSTFDLPEKQQTDIKSAVKEILGSETNFQFKTAPEIISGIELSSNGYKLAWSISEYLNSLQRSISETINEEPTDEQDSETEPESEINQNV